MSNVAVMEPQRRSITLTMATRFKMEPDAFLATLAATVFTRGMTREEQAAFLLVADQYNLNPVTREIYAMPKKGGGIIPVVSIDGWIRMANEHPSFDGMEFESEHAGDKLVSTTCRIFRKDRSHPIAVTEYLAECKRDTDPWKMQHRMLRHKAMIQCARYAFGFAGIYDQDEAERFAEPLARPAAPVPPTPPIPPSQVKQLPATSSRPEKDGEVEGNAVASPSASDALEAYNAALKQAMNMPDNDEALDAVETAWAAHIEPLLAPDMRLTSDEYERASSLDNAAREAIAR